MPHWTEPDALAALATLPGMSRRSLAALRARYRTFSAACEVSTEELATQASAAFVGAGDALRRTPDLRAHLAEVRSRATAAGVTLLTEADPSWPERLREIDTTEADAQPPVALYVRGDLAPLEWGFSVAIVGPRRADALSREQAGHLAAGLSRAGVAVVSGGAMGIDSVVHRAALDAGGYTVAVLGSGVDKPTPTRNRALFEEIIEGGGAVISEEPLGAGAGPGAFPRRNRIVSGLADAVIVVAARNNSGSLITAGHAARQERIVMAVPGDPRRALNQGSNRLLVRGAAAVLDPEDVIELLFEILGDERDGGMAARWLQSTRGGLSGALAAGNQFPLSPAAATILNHLDSVPVSADLIASRVKLDGAAIAAALAELEVVGLASQVSGGYVLSVGPHPR